MKLSELTRAVFDAEMQKILSGMQDLLLRMQINVTIGGLELMPSPVMVGDDRFPFPLAADIWPVWQYATGEAPRPVSWDWQDVMQSTCELLWCTVGGHSYDIPASFWQEPLGIVFEAAEARDALAGDEYLSPDQLAILAGLTRQNINLALQSKAIKGRKYGGKWRIQAADARAYLETPRQIGRPKKEKE